MPLDLPLPPEPDGGALEHQHVGHAELDQGPGRAESGHAATDDHDLGRAESRHGGQVGPAGDPAGAGQRDPGHGGGLDRQRDQVLGLEMVHVGLPAGPGQRGHLHGERAQVVGHRGGGVDGIEPRLERGVLGGDADRAAPGVAVRAVPGRGAQRGVVGGDVDRLRPRSSR